MSLSKPVDDIRGYARQLLAIAELPRFGCQTALFGKCLAIHLFAYGGHI